MPKTWYSDYEPFATQVNSKKSILASTKRHWFSYHENVYILKIY